MGLTIGSVLQAKRAKTFENWIDQVDRVLWLEACVSHSDLPDICYRDMYEDGVSPKTAAKRAIKNAKDW